MQIAGILCVIFLYTVECNVVAQHRNIGLFNKANCGKTFRDRIVVHHREAYIGEFPWTALLRYKRINGIVSNGCMGSLISDKYVLTAAQCITKDLVGVRLGEFDLRTDPDCKTEEVIGEECTLPVQDIDVKRSLKHPQYDNKQHDIALIELKTAPVVTDFVLPICLSTEDNAQQINAFTAVGWGLVNKNSSTSVLSKTDLVRQSLQECQTIYAKHKLNITDSQFCIKEKAGACYADGGAPIMWQTTDALAGYKFYQYGIVSFGSTQCGSEVPTVCTDVAKHLSWILDNITA